MYETLHLKQRVRQRGITNRMIELTLKYGIPQKDKIKLGIKHIKELLQSHGHLKADLLKILDKGGLIVVVSNNAIITAYNWN